MISRIIATFLASPEKTEVSFSFGFGYRASLATVLARVRTAQYSLSFCGLSPVRPHRDVS